MIIIGVDYHPSDQYIAFVDTETGEYEERQLNHSDREAEKFYRELAARAVERARGNGGHRLSRWSERLLAELEIEVWIGMRRESRPSESASRRRTERRPTAAAAAAGT